MNGASGWHGFFGEGYEIADAVGKDGVVEIVSGMVQAAVMRAVRVVRHALAQRDIAAGFLPQHSAEILSSQREEIRTMKALLDSEEAQ